MPDPFIAEIRMFGGNFAPSGWALCNGQLLSIASNQALFSILGTTYGGNGETNFGLPDLRGRVPIHPGMGPGLSSVSLGQRAGSQNITPSVTTTLAQSDEAHTHELAGGTVGGSVGSTSVATFQTPGSASSTAQTFDNRQPYLAVNFIIAIIGTFPSFD